MRKKFNLTILVVVFSFVFFAAKAQNEGAIRMPISEVTETYEEQPKTAPEVVVNNNISKEVIVKKAIEKKEVIKKVNELKADAKVVKADRIKKNLKSEQTSISQNAKIAIILIVIGIVLSVIPNFALWFIGLILVLIGLVLLLLEIL
jgi:hypothetical protein